METKTLHVVSSSAAKVTLEMGKVKDDIVFLPINLSCAYIPKDFSDKELCFALASQNKIGIFDQFKDFITKDYSVYDRVIVWHGWAASDLLLLYLMSTLIEDNLYQITITDYPVFKKRHESAPFVGMGWVCPMDVIEMMSYIKPISRSDLKKYKELWNHWKETKTPYRFSDIHTGIIKEYPSDFMDSTIIDIVRQETQISRVVGLVMGKFLELPIPDYMILKRLMDLWYMGKCRLEIKNVDEKKTISHIENWVKIAREEIEVMRLDFESTLQRELENWTLDEEVAFSILDNLRDLDSTIDNLSDYVSKAKTLIN